jgi:hypothetical protein
MSRKQLENFLEQERRHKLGASIARFAVIPEESDEEKENLKREKIIHQETLQGNAPRNAKKAAEEGTHTSTSCWNTNQKLIDLE